MLDLVSLLHRDRDAFPPPSDAPLRSNSSGSLMTFLGYEAPDANLDGELGRALAEWGGRTRSLRVAFRLLLVYMQQAPLDVATKVPPARIPSSSRPPVPFPACAP